MELKGRKSWNNINKLFTKRRPKSTKNWPVG